MHRKLRAHTAAFLALLLALLSACQPTPEVEPVVNKGDGVYEQKLSEAQATAAPQNGQAAASAAAPVPTAAPDPYLTQPHWQEAIAFRNFTIDIDVDVEAPEAGLFPVYAVEGADFADGDARVAQVLDCLLEDVVGVRPGGDTREDVYRMMQAMLQGQYDEASGEFIPPNDDEAERIVSEMTELAATAPTADSYEPAPGIEPVATGTHRAYKLANGEEWDVRIEPDALTVQRLPGGAVQPERWVLEGAAVAGETPHPLEHVELTQAEAEAIVADFLERADIGTFGVSLMEKARIVRNYTGETISEGYRFECTRVGGDCLPFSFRQYSGGNSLRFSDDAYAPGLPQETMTLYVDGGGVRQFVWTAPLTIVEQAAQNIELLPFDQMQSLIRQALRASLSWTGDKQSGSVFSGGRVTRVVLSACCIPQKDAPGRFYLTPAWFVLVSLNELEAKGALPQAIAINAVDGSRIAIENAH